MQISVVLPKLVLRTVSIVAALLAALVLSSLRTVPYSAEKGQNIDGAFRDAAAFIDSRAETLGRLPETKDLEGWKLGRDNWRQNVHIYPSDQVPSEAKRALGAVPPGGYVLSIWRGEWMEYYASWSSKSTVVGKSDLMRDTFVAAAILLVAAVTLWWWSGRFTRRANAA